MFIYIKDKVHIISNLSYNIIIINDILYSYRYIINVGLEETRFRSYMVLILIFKRASALTDIPVFLAKKVKRAPPQRRKIIIYTAKALIIDLETGLNISIKY